MLDWWMWFCEKETEEDTKTTTVNQNVSLNCKRVKYVYRTQDPWNGGLCTSPKDKWYPTQGNDNPITSGRTSHTIRFPSTHPMFTRLGEVNVGPTKDSHNIFAPSRAQTPHSDLRQAPD
jgi:hypothetical protein